MGAQEIRELFHILLNISRDDLEQAGVITPNAKGGSDWKRFNNEIGMFVLKLPADRLEKLAALIEEQR